MGWPSDGIAFGFGRCRVGSASDGSSIWDSERREMESGSDGIGLAGWLVGKLAGWLAGGLEGSLDGKPGKKA